MLTALITMQRQLHAAFSMLSMSALRKAVGALGMKGGKKDLLAKMETMKMQMIQQEEQIRYRDQEIQSLHKRLEILNNTLASNQLALVNWIVGGMDGPIMGINVPPKLPPTTLQPLPPRTVSAREFIQKNREKLVQFDPPPAEESVNESEDDEQV